jgi:hypothetical protein
VSVYYVLNYGLARINIGLYRFVGIVFGKEGPVSNDFVAKELLCLIIGNELNEFAVKLVHAQVRASPRT